MNEIIANFKDVLQNKYVEFKGRANRKEFWYFFLVVIVINIIFNLLSKLFGGSMVIFALQGLVFLGLLLPGLAISVRRMHDIGKGGGWILVNLIPIIGSILFLVLAAKEGEGENRFD